MCVCVLTVMCAWPLTPSLHTSITWLYWYCCVYSYMITVYGKLQNGMLITVAVVAVYLCPATAC